MWAEMMVPGGRVYGGSGMAAILQGVSIPPETIEAFLSSASPPACLNGPGPMMNFEAARGSTTPDRPLLPHPAYTTPPVVTTMADSSDLDDFGYLQQHLLLHPNNQPDPKKRRLSSDQVQFLERSFEAENKLEPERKAELARSLGLQPRQVAIWFQNRRARWKTKQLERDYETVREGYEGLKREYEAARKEKEKLEAEVNYLRQQLLNRQKRSRNSSGVDTPDEIKPQIVTEERKMKTRSKVEVTMFPLPHEEQPAETDRSEICRAEGEGLQGAAAAAAAAASGCRYEFPTGLDEHLPLWMWHPAEFCGP